MSKFTFELGPDGKVTKSPAMIEDDLVELIARFQQNLAPWECKVLDNLIHLWDYNGVDTGLTKEGWGSFIATFRETEDLIYANEPTIEISEEAYEKLEKRLLVEQESDPSLTKEDLLSKIILAIPLPD